MGSFSISTPRLLLHSPPSSSSPFFPPFRHRHLLLRAAPSPRPRLAAALSPIVPVSAPQTPDMAVRGGSSDVFDLLLQDRIIFLFGEINDFLADAVVSQLLLLDARDPTRDIKILINSSGGSLSSAMAILDVVQLVRADVSTVAFGMVASVSSIVLGGGTKGKRLAMPNARIMISQPLGGASGSVTQVEIQAEEIHQTKFSVIRAISGFTGRTVEEVEDDIEGDRYMSPIEAFEYGIIDGVIDKDTIIPPPPLPESMYPSSINGLFVDDPEKFLNPDVPDEEIY